MMKIYPHECSLAQELSSAAQRTIIREQRSGKAWAELCPAGKS